MYKGVNNHPAHLVIDIGNTLCKAAVFKGSEMVALWTGKLPDKAAVDQLVQTWQPGAAILSSVRKNGTSHQPLHRFIHEYPFPVLTAGPDLSLPVTNLYKTPETLGSDRIAAAIAAQHFFPGQNTLVINTGTCLTTDFLTKNNEYLGGTIAPGLQMRFKSLNRFTGNLPLVEINPAQKKSGPAAVKPEADNGNQPEIPDLPGQSTRDSILAGVIRGMTAEIDGLIDQWREKISFFNVIMSGGDAKTFDKKLKNRIFAVENIVLYGLNLMLKHNAQHL
ncbi:MAG: type III pantothenate kinase [Bacteroidia bacterium]|nr:MAG: type III pantothenate kinase [Bacteroidia bacterium]